MELKGAFGRLLYCARCLPSSIKRYVEKNSKMLGFGALKAMNDTIKLNRDMLKASRKNAADRSSIQAKVSENLLLNDKKMSEEDRVKLIHSTWKSNREDNVQKILVLILSVGIVSALIWALGQIFKF